MLQYIKMEKTPDGQVSGELAAFFTNEFENGFNNEHNIEHIIAVQQKRISKNFKLFQAVILKIFLSSLNKTTSLESSQNNGH